MVPRKKSPPKKKERTIVLDAETLERVKDLPRKEDEREAKRTVALTQAEQLAVDEIREKIEGRIKRHLAKKTDRTKELYKVAWTDFAGYLAREFFPEIPFKERYIKRGKKAKQTVKDYDGGIALFKLATSSPGDANDIVEGYQGDMKERRISPSQRNIHVSAIKSYLKAIRKSGLITWTLDVDGEKVQSYKDTDGPGWEAFIKMIKASKSNRDRAILVLFLLHGLRRNELITLDYPDHVDLRKGKIDVLRKGKEERVRIDLQPQDIEILKAWLDERSRVPGPLFVSFAPQSQGERLSPVGLWEIIKRAAKRAGVADAWPHGLRHSAISKLLFLNNGNFPETMAFAGHSSPEMVRVYDDNNKKYAKRASARIAQALSAEIPDLVAPKEARKKVRRKKS